MSQRTSTQRRTWKERALSLLLTAALTVGLVPGLTLPASAEHWADAYLDQLVDWGVMRADQTSDPDADLTRAEFFAVINRAYGYTETGYIPFEDVLETDWFYDDISIAYTAGYMAGTSATTASPNDPLTREQAFCILGRNMMLVEVPGENLAFADSREISDWARGTIKAASDRYIVSGFPDNTLHPQDSISKGQMAVLVSQCLGTPIRESGTYDLGGVFGNVTITAPNVTLRNATISGDLYISGGVGLGGIKLENVDVLGRIIVSSTGESEGGSASVIMRNVTAEEMLVDNMRSKTVTIRADGITDIAKTVVRTNAYLEDNNTDDKGLMHIEVDGDPGLRLTLAGRIKEVVNKTPASYIQAAQGTVAKLTVDEAATNSIVQIDRNTKISELNLDVATNVLGDGDIGKLNVNAPGSVVTMLPDDIYIRPGLNASIAGVIMDYQSAKEGSLDPRLLSGYPAAKDIAPTGFRADFAGNKKGTIYWGVSYVSDGSIGEDDLISPPSYGNKAIANGSVAEPSGGEEVSAQVGNLVVGGSYYLSAILVDEMKERSPVKVISFSTPDNTIPAFAQGYPQMSRISSKIGESIVTVMPTKSCKLYYALLPQGAKAPTANEMRAAAVTGNLGYGVRDVTKNTESVFPVNSQQLEELKTYVLYLWLTDADGATSSTVTSLSFTIPDETPPEFVVHPYMTGNALATSVPMAATVNENATIFWAVVEAGIPYPLPNNSSTDPDENVTDENGRPISSSLSSDYAKLCVTSGMGALQRGQVAARANTEVTFNITGLQAEKAYDLYYLARDAAGNYTVQVYKLQGGLHTLDSNGPTVTQSFSSIPSPQDAPNEPDASTDITLDFSENIHTYAISVTTDILTLYNERTQSGQKMEDYIKALSSMIVLYHYNPSGDPKDVKVPAWNEHKGAEPGRHWIDYYNAIIESTTEGHVRITFPGTGSRYYEPAIKLANGEQYYFQFCDIADTSTANNGEGNHLNQDNNAHMDYTNADAKHSIDKFETVFSEVQMGSYGIRQNPIWKGSTKSGMLPNEAVDPSAAEGLTIHAQPDVNFRLNPQSTEDVNDEQLYDVLFFTNTILSFDLYYRIVEKSNTDNGVESGGASAGQYAGYLIQDYTPPSDPTYSKRNTPDENGWRYLGNHEIFPGRGLSLGNDFTHNSADGAAGYPRLNTLSEDLFYEFVISVTSLDILPDREDWSRNDIYIDIFIEAGRSPAIPNLGKLPSNRADYESRGKDAPDGVANIGLNQQDGRSKSLHLPIPFANPQPPKFQSNAPWFTRSNRSNIPPRYTEDMVPLVGDDYAWLYLNLNAFGKVHYVAVERNTDDPVLSGVPSGTDVWDLVPADGRDPMLDTSTGGSGMPTVTNVQSQAVARHDMYFSERPRGTYEYRTTGTVPAKLEKLRPETDYYLYIVLEANTDSEEENMFGALSQVYVYKFRTAKTTAPRIRLDPSSTGTVTVNTAWGDSDEFSVEAELDWRIFESSEAGILQGTNSFSYLLANPEIEAYYRNPARGLKDLEGNEIGGPGIDTLYEALCTEYHDTDVYGSSGAPTGVEFDDNFNGYTLFFLFASTTERTNVQSIIDSMRGVSDLNHDTIFTYENQNNYKTVVPWTEGPNANIKNPENGGPYLFLIAGHNTTSSTGTSDWSSVNSFRLVDYIQYANKDAPELNRANSVQGAIWVDGANPSTPTANPPVNLTVGANVSMLFNKEVWWKVGTSFYPVVGNQTKTVGSSSTDTLNPNGVDLLYKATLTTNSGATVTSVGSNNPSFTLDFAGITRQTSNFTFLSSDGSIAAYQGDSAGPIQVRITFGPGDTVSRVISDTATETVYWDTTYWDLKLEFAYNVQDDDPDPWIPLDSHSEAVYIIERRITKPPVTNNASVPRLISATPTLNGSPTAGSYSLTVPLKFDQAVYQLSGTDVSEVNNILTDNKYTQAGNTSSVGIDTVKSNSHSDFTLTLSLKPNFGTSTFTLLPTGTICDKTGTASTSDKIKVTVSEVNDTTASTGFTTKKTQVEVQFGDQTFTNIVG